ncbi:MAG: hypothetical protein J2P21_31555 [Chloracidobacterium sp.]|nr:hypothetical protein [Chloracidobacterium sp.]
MNKIAVLPPIRNKLLAFSLGIDHALGVGRADHLAGLLVHQDARRSAVGETERAEINVFGDERVNEMLASSAIDGADERSSATAASSS